MKDINQYILEKFKISKSTIENDHIQTGDKADILDSAYIIGDNGSIYIPFILPYLQSG